MRQAEIGEILIRETLQGMNSAAASLLIAPVEIIPAKVDLDPD